LTYRTLVLLFYIAGLVPATIFLVFFIGLDRPRRWDRYAHLIGQLATVVFLAQFVPLLLTIIRDLYLPPPSSPWEWALALLLRSLAPYITWRIVWLYFHPPRDRDRGDTPEPGSIPRIQ